MKSNHARKIPARAPRVVQPESYSAPQTAQQGPPATVRRAAPGNGVTAEYMASRAQNVFYVEPSISAADNEDGTTIRIDGHRHRIPRGVEVAFGRSGGRDFAYLHRVLHSVVVLVAVRGVGVRELAGIPADVLSDLRAQFFPEGWS